MEEHRSHEPGIPGQYRVELYGRDAHIGVPMYRTTIFSCTIQVHTITSLLGFVHCYLLFMGTWYCFALADLLFAFLVTCYPFFTIRVLLITAATAVVVVQTTGC